MGMLVWVGFLAFFVASLVVGIRLLLLWSRTRELPELLIGIGIPLVGFVTYQNGPWVGLIVLIAGMSMLRWPVIYLGRWARSLWVRSAD